MNRLIKLQLRNVFHNKLFYVCLGINLLLSVILVFVGEMTIVKTHSKVFPQIVSLLSSELGLISEVFVAIFCCLDFNEGTTKNIIARGYSRMQLLISKYIVVLIGLFTMYIINFLVIMVLFVKNGMGFESNMILLILMYLISIIATTIFYATLSFLLEKNSSAIIACLFVPTILSLVFGVVDSNLKINISKFWIDNLSNIFVSKQTIANFGLTTLYYGIYVVVIVFVGSKILDKKEIK